MIAAVVAGLVIVLVLLFIMIDDRLTKIVNKLDDLVEVVKWITQKQ